MKREKILSGPWKGSPTFRPEELSDEVEEIQSSAPTQFNAIPVAPSSEFLRIVASARAEDILPSKIADEIRRYSRWSREQLLGFVNNPANYAGLQQKPVFVLALHALIERKRV
jgi:hypothetical protein